MRSSVCVSQAAYQRKRLADRLWIWAWRFPESPGHEFLDLALWMAVDDGESFGEVGNGIDVVEPAGGHGG